MKRFLPIIAIIFAIAVIFIYVRPTWAGAITKNSQDIASYDSALAAADRFQQKEAELTQERAKIPADSLSKLNAFLPDGVDNVQLILDMDGLAARSGIALSDFDIKGGDLDSTDTSSASQTAPSLDTTSSSPIDSLDLTFKATGSYTAFRSFLAAIENSLRPLDVTDLTISKSDTGVYTYQVTVRIYWLR